MSSLKKLIHEVHRRSLWQRFAELWADAAPELQRRGRPARERAEAMGGASGEPSGS